MKNKTFKCTLNNHINFAINACINEKTPLLSNLTNIYSQKQLKFNDILAPRPLSTSVLTSIVMSLKITFMKLVMKDTCSQVSPHSMNPKLKADKTQHQSEGNQMKPWAI
jgi:hypothetical protein